MGATLWGALTVQQSRSTIYTLSYNDKRIVETKFVDFLMASRHFNMILQLIKAELTELKEHYQFYQELYYIVFRALIYIFFLTQREFLYLILSKCAYTYMRNIIYIYIDGDKSKLSK